jgi:nucleoside 2-deoxyribosyltransferase
MPKRPSVYLAGPDVFLPDARAAGDELKALCAAAGLDALFPLDAEIPAARPRSPELAYAIAATNEALIRRCDALLANLTPFRGPSADVGTVYEVGYARGLGKPVVAYTLAREPFAQRTLDWLGRSGEPIHRRADGSREDSAQMQIEDFGEVVDNLMIPAGILAGGGAIVTPRDADAARLHPRELAVQRLAALLRERSSTA